MIVSAVLLIVCREIEELRVISEGISLIAPLGSLLMFFLFLKLPRKIKITPMMVTIILDRLISRLLVCCLVRILFIFHNNVHFLRLHNVLLNDVICCVIVIY